MESRSVLYPFLVTLLAVAALALMDVFMKTASLAVGAYSALLIRSWVSVALMLPLYLARGGRWPGRKARRVHLIRGVVSTGMALTFFSALVLLPVAEAIALSFIAPIIALALAALLLKERIGRSAISAALLGLVGVGVIISGRLNNEGMASDSMLGIGLILTSAFLYAWNLVLQRQQALLSKPVEIGTAQNLVIGVMLLAGIPFFLNLPHDAQAWQAIVISSVLSLSGAMLVGWSYARAEAQVLVPVEYSGFVWSALFGWLLLREEVSLTTIAGAVLIVAACWIAAPRKAPEQIVT
tara:strand:- start:245 stop:1132 length:888 start_codon:yes stop_codon:yes gene_type:complete